MLSALHLEPFLLPFFSGLCIYPCRVFSLAVPSAWCAFPYVISWLHFSHPQISALMFNQRLPPVTAVLECSGRLPTPLYPWFAFFCSDALLLIWVSFAYCLPPQLECQPHESRQGLLCWLVCLSIQTRLLISIYWITEWTWPQELAEIFFVMALYAKRCVGAFIHSFGDTVFIPVAWLILWAQGMETLEEKGDTSRSFWKF